jgi:hypothetical protein
VLPLEPQHGERRRAAIGAEAAVGARPLAARQGERGAGVGHAVRAAGLLRTAAVDVHHCGGFLRVYIGVEDSEGFVGLARKSYPGHEFGP